MHQSLTSGSILWICAQEYNWMLSSFNSVWHHVLLCWTLQLKCMLKWLESCFGCYRCNDQYTAHSYARFCICDHPYDFWEKGDSKLKHTTGFYLKTSMFIIINFLISKNKVGTFGCVWVALGFKADTSIAFFHVEVTFDDVCSILKHKI